MIFADLIINDCASFRANLAQCERNILKFVVYCLHEIHRYSHFEMKIMKDLRIYKWTRRLLITIADFPRKQSSADPLHRRKIKECKFNSIVVSHIFANGKIHTNIPLAKFQPVQLSYNFHYVYWIFCLRTNNKTSNWLWLWD